MAQLVVTLKGAYKLPGKEGKIDPYVKLKFGKTALQSEHKPNTTDPQWEESPTFEFKINDMSQKLSVDVFDKKILGSDKLLARTELPINRYRRLGIIDKKFPLVDAEGDDAQCDIHLALEIREDDEAAHIMIMKQMREHGSLRDVVKAQKEGEEREDLQRQLTEYKNTQINLEERYAQVKNEKEDLQKANIKLETDNERLNSENDSLKSVDDKVSRDDFDKLCKEHEELFQELESKNSECEELISERSKILQQKTDLSNALAEAAKNCEKALSDLNIERKSHSTLREEHQKIEIENERFNDSLRNLGEEYQDLQKEMQRLKQKLEEIEKKPKAEEVRADSAATSVFSLVAGGAVDAVVGLF